MRVDEVPQDNSSTYAGHKKLLYARDVDGHYTPIQSSGWEPEACATQDAVALYESQAREARLAVEQGVKSPLYFHMYNCRMDLLLLSQLTGLWRWRIRRHFKPQIFASLNNGVLMRYAVAMDKTPIELQTLPDNS
ncbi:hypothetical protein [Gilvimarinus polysaccharolyticus]|uniref:hypothetical protein n=1 Tax=Gilvimarinus polysaccharolyticus TaxID=863921 RepID=UPI000673490E|nr:hypothetical protein [Gilvimarinus polysaccharolyticus]